MITEQDLFDAVDTAAQKFLDEYGDEETAQCAALMMGAEQLAQDPTYDFETFGGIMRSILSMITVNAQKEAATPALESKVTAQ